MEVDLSSTLGQVTTSCSSILASSICFLWVQSVQDVLAIHIVIMILAILIVLQEHLRLLIISVSLAPKEQYGMEILASKDVLKVNSSTKQATNVYVLLVYLGTIKNVLSAHKEGYLIKVQKPVNAQKLKNGMVMDV